MNKTNCNGFLNGKNCYKQAILLYKGEPYCIGHWKIKYKEKEP